MSKVAPHCTCLKLGIITVTPESLAVQASAAGASNMLLPHEPESCFACRGLPDLLRGFISIAEQRGCAAVTKGLCDHTPNVILLHVRPIPAESKIGRCMDISNVT